MPDTADDSNEEVAKYQFIPDAHACDVCQSMEGVYEDAPHVPLHPHCACQIVRLAADSDNCQYEIRDLSSNEEYYSESEIVATFELPRRLDSDTDASTDVTLGVEDYSFDEGVLEAVEDKFGWSPNTYTARISQTLPAGTSGTVEIEVEFRMGATTFLGDRWSICSTQNDDGSTTVTETNIGSVGGMAIERTGIESFDIHAQDDDGSGGGYFDPEDELPT
jgi:hypothetical protein